MKRVYSVLASLAAILATIWSASLLSSTSRSNTGLSAFSTVLLVRHAACEGKLMLA
jgi:hypothetical protein